MTTKYDMVFEGGGAKGMAFVGALQVLEEHSITFDRLLGTSAGAITATCVAAGYDHQEMLSALNEQVDGKSVFATFLEIPPPRPSDEIDQGNFAALLRSVDLPLVPEFVEARLDRLIVKHLQRKDEGRQMLSFIDFGGMYSAENFLAWLRKNLDTGEFQGQPRHFSKMTLKEFFDATKVDLTLVAADVSDSRLLFLNHRTAPDCPLVFAVRMSMSVPLVWPEVIWKAEWGKYDLGFKTIDLTNHAVVDGGLLSNFPIELLISDAPQVVAVMGPRQPASDPKSHVLGFLIDESLAVPMPLAFSLKEVILQSQTVRRLTGLMNAATQAHDKMVIEAFEDCIVRLPAKDYGTLEFDMPVEKRAALIQAGYQATKEHLEFGGAALGFEPIEPLSTAELANRRARSLLSR